MRIELENIGKRYRKEWILKGINLEFQEKKAYAITGPNGSGKSTLLRILSGHLSPSRGTIRFSKAGKKVDPGEVYKELSFAAPYTALIEEFTLLEAIQFHQKFKPFPEGLHTENFIDRLSLQRSRNKPIRNFSSGMKQRLKLGLSICTSSQLLLLDEPTTNLDQENSDLYQQLIQEFGHNRLIIIASNLESDYHFCDEIIDVKQFK